MEPPLTPSFKVVIIGDENVGKTSLVRQLCEHKFETSQTPSRVVDFHIKPVELPDGWVKITIWDVAGPARFQVVRESFYPGCTAAALVFDLSTHITFDHLEGWLEEIRKVVPQIKILLVGNKKDIEHSSPVNLSTFLKKEVLIPYIETSAKTSEGVEEMFTLLANEAHSASKSQ